MLFTLYLPHKHLSQFLSDGNVPIRDLFMFHVSISLSLSALSCLCLLYFPCCSLTTNIYCHNTLVITLSVLTMLLLISVYQIINQMFGIQCVVVSKHACHQPCRCHLLELLTAVANKNATGM